MQSYTFWLSEGPGSSEPIVQGVGHSPLDALEDAVAVHEEELYDKIDLSSVTDYEVGMTPDLDELYVRFENDTADTLLTVILHDQMPGVNAASIAHLAQQLPSRSRQE